MRGCDCPLVQSKLVFHDSPARFPVMPALAGGKSLQSIGQKGICALLQLACARIGAVHSVVFAGFSAESLAGRVMDSRPDVILTCSGVRRGPKALSLKVSIFQHGIQQTRYLSAVLGVVEADHQTK